MTPEERAVQLCPTHQDHAHGNVDALGKCCEACQPIADAIRAAVKEEREACACVADDYEYCDEHGIVTTGAAVGDAIRARNFTITRGSSDE